MNTEAPTPTTPLADLIREPRPPHCVDPDLTDAPPGVPADLGAALLGTRVEPGHDVSGVVVVG